MQSTLTPSEKTGPAWPRRSLRGYVGIALRGVAMGASDIVPGVSGGTMAFILGIYEELIQSIRTVGRAEFIQAVVGLRWREALTILNWPFLLAVATGILVAIATLARGLEWTLHNQPVLLWSFFFGLVLASVLTVSRRVTRWTPPLWLTLAAGAVAAFVVVGLVPARTPDTWWFLLLSGALAICAMILPGISGAFILVLLGKYAFVLAAVNQRDIVSLGLVAGGAAIGIVTFAQLLGWLFEKRHNGMVAVLTGLMLGSLRKIWPWKMDVAWLTDAAGEYIVDSDGLRIVTQQANTWPDLSLPGAQTQLLIAVALAAAGFLAVVLLDRLAGGKR